MSWYDPSHGYSPDEIADELGPEVPPITAAPRAVAVSMIYAGKYAPLGPGISAPAPQVSAPPRPVRTV